MAWIVVGIRRCLVIFVLGCHQLTRPCVISCAGGQRWRGSSNDGIWKRVVRCRRIIDLLLLAAIQRSGDDVAENVVRRRLGNWTSKSRGSFISDDRSRIAAIFEPARIRVVMLGNSRWAGIKSGFVVSNILDVLDCSSAIVN